MTHLLENKRPDSVLIATESAPAFRAFPGAFRLPHRPVRIIFDTMSAT